MHPNSLSSSTWPDQFFTHGHWFRCPVFFLWGSYSTACVWNDFVNTVMEQKSGVRVSCICSTVKRRYVMCMYLCMCILHYVLCWWTLDIWWLFAQRPYLPGKKLTYSIYHDFLILVVQTEFECRSHFKMRSS